MSDPKFQPVTETTIDLKIIQTQLDNIESVLIMAWRYFGVAPHTQEQTQQISHAIDLLIAVKKSFALTSDFIPVKEQQSATTIRQVMIDTVIKPDD